MKIAVLVMFAGLLWFKTTCRSWGVTMQSQQRSLKLHSSTQGRTKKEANFYFMRRGRICSMQSAKRWLMSWKNVILRCIQVTAGDKALPLLLLIRPQPLISAHTPTGPRTDVQGVQPLAKRLAMGMTKPHVLHWDILRWNFDVEHVDMRRQSRLPSAVAREGSPGPGNPDCPQQWWEKADLIGLEMMRPTFADCWRCVLFTCWIVTLWHFFHPLTEPSNLWPGW